jgi:hypothetical protein
MPILTNAALETLMLDPTIRKGQFIRLDSKTEARATVKSRTTSEPFAAVFDTSKVWKINSRTVQLRVDYQNAVNGRREKEGLEKNFQSKGTYGEVENDTLVRKPDGSFNVRVYHVKHPDDSVRWLRDDGTELSPDLVARLKAEFLPKPKPEGEGKQGLENAVQPLDFKPESILALRMAGVDYIMAHV